jgi:hypothetical protein
MAARNRPRHPVLHTKVFDECAFFLRISPHFFTKNPAIPDELPEAATESAFQSDE